MAARRLRWTSGHQEKKNNALENALEILRWGPEFKLAIDFLQSTSIDSISCGVQSANASPDAFRRD